MEFYIIVHILVGAISWYAMVYKNISMRNVQVYLSDYILVSLMKYGSLAAIITSFAKAGIWGFATIIEILGGILFIEFFIRPNVKSFGESRVALYLSFIPFVIIFGALWGFWRILK